MILEELLKIHDFKTDKHTIHSYIPVYEELFSSIRDTAENIFEIGIAYGGSLELWSHYFSKAQIYGVDVTKFFDDELLKNPRLTLTVGTSAYTRECVEAFKIHGKKFDVIIDDGPHTLASMVYTISHYTQFLTDVGMMIIEDIKDPSWCDVLISSIPDGIDGEVIIRDLRSKKGRYDDIMLILKKKI